MHSSLTSGPLNITLSKRYRHSPNSLKAEMSLVSSSSNINTNHLIQLTTVIYLKTHRNYHIGSCLTQTKKKLTSKHNKLSKDHRYSLRALLMTQLIIFILSWLAKREVIKLISLMVSKNQKTCSTLWY